ncbi:MerR family transcriptional regulator [Streptacidiphilus jiangxiensis]|uniref:DNA-binding transcriptional regulator, MerR family n=1 Tax=Streptacidiphilus jiangxiensis TaxID=235985 RepID=A0A1H7HRD5_STRJI|nr:MerR family transcriptional regulator [Streptacidiphilus jiangxiensis]SEK52734.1 DNA-binding transcriptional regulator, MerR family [Streptacidiphilus jiangxiensis]
MPPRELLSIGELAERAGVTVKAVRFYSEQGLLPEAERSGGGHRRYAPEALERLRTIRALRGLEVPLPQVSQVMAEHEDGADSGLLGDLVARRLEALGAEMRALRWREAALRLVHEADEGQRTELVRMVGVLGSPPSTDALARYWRRLLPGRLAARLRTAVVDAAVPTLPEEPTAAHVLAFARLHALTVQADDACLAEHRPAPPRPDLLYDGLREAYELSVPALRAGREPGTASDEAVDCFVAAHARSADRRDTPVFRRELGRALAGGEHPAMRCYWRWAGELSPEPTIGAAHSWLSSALAARLGAGEDGVPVAG